MSLDAGGRRHLRRDQGSRLSAVRWSEDHAVKEILQVGSFDEDDLYATLDDLAQRQASIEVALAPKAAVSQARTIYLYDVTSVYFEGLENELADFGYNRDGKAGKKQLVAGLLTDGEGEPISIQLYRGNTGDPPTFLDAVQKLKARFGAEQVALVGDRGMIKRLGKAALGEVRFCYVTALTDPARSPLFVALGALLVAAMSSTQDIVVDAFRVESLPESEQAAGMASYVAAYRIGMLVSTAGALFLEGRLYFYQLDGTRAKGNSGGPSVLLAYGEANARLLRQCPLKGAYCTTTARHR